MTEQMDIDQEEADYELTLTGFTSLHMNTTTPAQDGLVATQETFTPFRRLPLEVRTMIWDASISEPRVIIVRAPRHIIVSEPYYHWHTRLDPKSRAEAIPTILHVSAEARSVAQKKYVPLAARWGKPIYFDFRKDILQVEGGALAEICGARYAGISSEISFLFPVDVREWQVNLRHLELIELQDVGSGAWGFNVKALQWMKSLETLSVEKRALEGRWGHKGPANRGAAKNILAMLAKYWLGPKDKLPEVTKFAYGAKG